MSREPDISFICKKAGLKYPVMGLYDTPNKGSYGDFVPVKSCVFSYFSLLVKGRHIRITKDQYGCGGAGGWLCGLETRSREEYVSFLTDQEGLKANHGLMELWLDSVKPYLPEHENLFFGPLVPSEYGYLKTVTFFVDPDQLSIFSIGAQLESKPADPEPVIAPFGSGCMQLISLFRDLEQPQAIIGATDMAMRQHLPLPVLAFTVTRPMFERLARVTGDSYLTKSFIQTLKQERKKQGYSSEGADS